jgi:hypothetical protein
MSGLVLNPYYRDAVQTCRRFSSWNSLATAVPVRILANTSFSENGNMLFELGEVTSVIRNVRRQT